jgi:hypothetical protein
VLCASAWSDDFVVRGVDVVDLVANGRQGGLVCGRQIGGGCRTAATGTSDRDERGALVSGFGD